MLGLLSGRLHHAGRRAGHRPHLLQGLRHLCRGVPGGRHLDGARGRARRLRARRGRRGGTMSAERTATVMTGNEAAAAAAKLARVQVIAAYPITPQSPVVEQLSEWVESGELPAEFVTVESEHSALTVCIAPTVLAAMH